jgi:hypothetical protein
MFFPLDVEMIYSYFARVLVTIYSNLSQFNVYTQF